MFSFPTLVCKLTHNQNGQIMRVLDIESGEKKILQVNVLCYHPAECSYAIICKEHIL